MATNDMESTSRGIRYPTNPTQFASSDWWRTLAMTANSAIATAEAAADYVKGTIDSSTDLDSLADGVYKPAGASTASQLGIPVPASGNGALGELRVSRAYSSEAYKLLDWQGLTGEAWVLRKTPNGWSEWEPSQPLATPENDGLMTAEDKEFFDSSIVKSPPGDEYTHRFVDAEGRVGLGVRTSGQIDGIGIGQPVPEVDPYSWSVRDAEGRVSELAIDRAGKIPEWVLDRIEQRRGWGSPGGSTSVVAPTDVWRRTLLIDDFFRRRGQVIGTGGKAAIALRFDHGLVKFRDQIIPLLDKYDLPAVQAMNVRSIDSTQNGNVPWATCLDWWANYGVEFSNHTASHASAGEAGTPEGRDNARDEIVNGLHELAEAMGNQFPIELFTPPGGVTVGEKELFDGGKTPESFYGTLWGQLILQHHAAAHGYIGGQLRPLPARNDLGLTIVGMDSSNASALIGWVDQAISADASVQFMHHPDELGKDGIIPIADVEAFFAHIAARRDAGELEVLSATGLLLADPTTDHRHDLLTAYRSLSDWTNTAGWTAETGDMWATTTTGGVMSTAFAMSPNFRHYRGGNRVLTYQVVAPEGAVVETTVTGSSGVIGRTKQHTIPAGGEPVTVRHHCALPMVSSPTITVRAGRVSGGPVTISSPRLITV